MAMVGTLKEFDTRSDDIQVYLGRLEQFFLANDISQEQRKAAILLTCIGDQTYKLLQDLAIPKEVGECTYVQLTTLLKEQLEPKHSIFAERCKFHRATQHENESIADWVARLKHLSQFCKFGTYLDTALRDQFIAGLKNIQILDRLFAEPETLSFTNAIEIAIRIEVAKQHRKDVVKDYNPNTHIELVNTKASTKLKSGNLQNTKVKTCTCCGKANHTKSQCKYIGYKCNFCGKTGHLAKLCFKKKKQQENTAKVTPHNLVNVNKEEEVLMHNLDNNTSVEPIFVHLTIDEKKLSMQLDTGAGVSIIPHTLYKKEFAHATLKKTNVVLKSFSGDKIYPVGVIKVMVEYQNHRKPLELFVVQNDGPSLLGRTWIKDLQICMPIYNVPSTLELDEILRKYHKLWEEELGTFNKFQLNLKIKENATPKFFKPRPIPYSIREKVEQELDRLVGQGVLTPVEYSEWGTPIVPVLKPDGNIRICGDYRVTTNPALIIDQYPLPKIEDLFAKLDGGTEYTKIDLSQAYQQCQLDNESRKLVTISTHKGLFQYTRLPFGIASAPAMFQRIMEQLFQGISNVVCFLDDILITGKTKDEHLQKLDQVLNILQESGLKLKKEKCSFLQKSVAYLGYVIDKDGLHTSEDKIAAIRDAPQPKDVTQLKAFLGIVNYYGRFVKDLSTILHPLHQLLRKNVAWKWSRKCQKAFLEVKEVLSSTEVLVHFNPELPVKLSCDASSYGIGAVLSHVFPNKEERPIAYGSRTLTKAEQNYSQLDKEALAIIFGLKKFNQYLFGRHFIIVTDHKPLISIFKPHKATPTMAASRLQRWCLTLAGYDYDIEYVTSKDNSSADGLSRLPLGTDVEGTALDMEEACSYLNYAEQGLSVVNARKVAKFTRQDRTLSEVMNYINHGWPNNINLVTEQAKPYWHKKEELYIELGCIMWGYRVIIPTKLRSLVKEELHSTHQGVVKMKAVARSYIWWPKLDKELEALARECTECASKQQMPNKAKLISWEWPTAPWHRIHVDFFTPVRNQRYLTILDSHSKWLEAFIMTSTTTEETLDKIREVCARYGLPEHIVTDNGSQFTSEEFHLFCKSNGIKHTKTATYHPSTNGAVENAIKNIKGALRKISTVDALNKFLLRYRITPHATTGETPAKLMIGRELKTRLDLLRPDIQKRVKMAQQSQSKFYRGKRDIQFKVGEKVYITKHFGKKYKWIPATVTTTLSNRNYLVQIENGEIWKRHIDQMRLRTTPSEMAANDSKAIEDGASEEDTESEPKSKTT